MNYVAHKYSSKPKRALKEALQLQKTLGWSKETTIAETCEKFIEMFPGWRIVVLKAAFPKSEFTYNGNQFAFDKKDKQKNIVYLVHDSISQHFGLITNPKEMFKSYFGRRDILFCDFCVKVHTPDGMIPSILEGVMEQIRSNRFHVVKTKKFWLTLAMS